jgi:predicted dehydrogenase
MIKEIELVGVSDPNEKNWEKVKSQRVHKVKDFSEWIDKVDGVIIAVPTYLHYSVAKACLNLKKHILLEKPLTKNFAQAEELFEIAAKNDTVLHTGHVERFNGAVQELKKLILKPHLIESHRIGPFAPRIQNDTVILDLMIHDLDIIANLVNSPVKKLNVVAKKVRSDLSDIAVVQIEFDNGTLANIISSRASEIKKRTMAIHQEDSFIQLDFTSQDIFIHRHATASVKVGHNQMRYQQAGIVERLFVYKENALKLEIEHFAKSIVTGKDKIAPKKDLEALKLSLEIETALGYSHDCINSRNRNSSRPCL